MRISKCELRVRRAENHMRGVLRVGLRHVSRLQRYAFICHVSHGFRRGLALCRAYGAGLGSVGFSLRHKLPGACVFAMRGSDGGVLL